MTRFIDGFVMDNSNDPRSKEAFKIVQEEALAAAKKIKDRLLKELEYADDFEIKFAFEVQKAEK